MSEAIEGNWSNNGSLRFVQIENVPVLQFDLMPLINSTLWRKKKKKRKTQSRGSSCSLVLWSKTMSHTWQTPHAMPHLHPYLKYLVGKKERNFKTRKAQRAPGCPGIGPCLDHTYIGSCRRPWPVEPFGLLYIIWESSTGVSLPLVSNWLYSSDEVGSYVPQYHSSALTSTKLGSRINAGRSLASVKGRHLLDIFCSFCSDLSISKHGPRLPEI